MKYYVPLMEDGIIIWYKNEYKNMPVRAVESDNTDNFNYYNYDES